MSLETANGRTSAKVRGVDNVIFVPFVDTKGADFFLLVAAL